MARSNISMAASDARCSVTSSSDLRSRGERQRTFKMRRYGYSIFCDDIRSEAGGKLSFIGCYNAVMMTQQKFPLVLSKFCIHFHVFSPATQPYTSVTARCYVPGEP